MARINPLDDKIRASFESSEAKAPEGLWAAMDQRMSANEADLDAQIKSSFDQESSSAPDSVWAGINRQLTIDAAWKGINAYLNRRAFYRWSARAALLLLFLFGAYLGGQILLEPASETTNLQEQLPVLPQIEQPKKSKLLPSEEGKTKQAGSLTPSAPEQAISLAEPMLAAASPIAQASSPSEIIGPYKTAIDSISAMDTSERELGLSPRDWHAFAFHLGLPNLRKPNVELSAPIAPKPKSKFKAWEIGLIYAYHRDFLSNNYYRESVDPRSLVTSNAVYSHNVSLDFRYRLHPRWALQMEWMPKRNLVLNYGIYSEGRFREESLSLSFSRIGLGFEHHFPLAINRQAFHIVMGAQANYSMLLDANLSGADQKDRYRNSLGMQFHLGQDWRSGPMVLSYGLRTDFNFNNLYRGDAIIPAAFDRTWYRSWGLYLGTRYRF